MLIRDVFRSLSNYTNVYEVGCSGVAREKPIREGYGSGFADAGGTEEGP